MVGLFPVLPSAVNQSEFREKYTANRLTHPVAPPPLGVDMMISASNIALIGVCVCMCVALI